jgi:hypothetical protein
MILPWLLNRVLNVLTLLFSKPSNFSLFTRSQLEFLPLLFKTQPQAPNAFPRKTTTLVLFTFNKYIMVR